MLYEELQCFVMSKWKLPQQVLDLEEDPVELHTDLGWGHRGGTEAKGLQFLQDDALAFLGQTDKVIIVAEQDEGLWKLQRKVWRKKMSNQNKSNKEANNKQRTKIRK